MYASRTTQFVVGIFAIVGIAALIILTLSLGKIPLLPQPGYTLYANFDDSSGLKPGDAVDIAGVQVGKVQAIAYKDFRSHVSMFIKQGVEVDKDAIAGIKTEGLLGNRYVSIALGPSDKILTDHDTIVQTESSFILENAIGQLINNIGSGGGGGSKDAGKTDNASASGSCPCGGQSDGIGAPPGASDKPAKPKKGQ
jgi:phospholipid/cholesterol/gamma-HCH transport system substrate-binding protein